MVRSISPSNDSSMQEPLASRNSNSCLHTGYTVTRAAGVVTPTVRVKALLAQALAEQGQISP